MADTEIQPNSGAPAGPEQTEVVISHDHPPTPVASALPVQPPTPVVPSTMPIPPIAPVQATTPQPLSIPAPAPEPPQQAPQTQVITQDYSAFEEPDVPTDDTEVSDEAVSWTASEFIAHKKSPSWYLGLGVVAVLASALIFLITHGIVSVAVVIISAILLGVYGAHEPRQLEYRIDQQGISIGNRQYSYDEFRSFSVVSEGAFSSVVLMPLKRFAVEATMHFPPEDEERILGFLSERLPFEEGRRDGVDSLMRRIRF